MTYIKINNALYPATVSGKIIDSEWDNRKSKSIKIKTDYETASKIFVSGLKWSIVQQNEVPTFDEKGNPAGTETRETEFDNSEYCLAGDLTDHRDGTVTAKMGKLTDLEEAYEIIFGGE